LLLIGLIIGLIVSSDKQLSLGIVKGWFVDPVLIFILIVQTSDEFNNIVFGLWVSGLVLALAALWQVLTGHFITPDQRASAWFGSANYLSLYLVPIMVLVLGWWRDIKKGYPQWIISLGWLIMLLALYFTFSYAGWLALLLGVLVFWWLTFPSVKILLIGLVGVLVAGLSQWHSPKLQHLWDLAGRSSSHVRLQVWQTAGLMIKENWLAGIGLGLFEKRYLAFANRLFHPPLELVILHAHNIFLQFWLNTGILGLGGFVWLLIVWFRQVWVGVKAKDFRAVAVFAAMVALLTHGMVDVAYWKNDLSALFWIIMALGVILVKPHGRKNLPDWH
jgi:O-antigen ligase